MTASRCAAARSTRACHSSALHSWRLMRETWNCMANLLANVVRVSLPPLPAASDKPAEKLPSQPIRGIARYCALMRTGHVAAVRPRKELVTFQLIKLHFGPPPARAGLQDTELARIKTLGAVIHVLGAIRARWPQWLSVEQA